MEIGGLLGTFSSGIVSDRVEGSRVPVIAVYLLGIFLGIVRSINVRLDSELSCFLVAYG